MNSKYMLLQNGPCQVPLKCGPKGYALKVANCKLNIDASSERLMIYWLYQTNNRGKFAEHLRSYFRVELTAMEIDNAIADFQAEHPSIPVSYYLYEDIPLMADPELGLNLPIPGYMCNITIEHENELLQTIIAEPYSNTKLMLQSWFRRYCNDYGLNYDKKCKGEQYKYLAESFLEQHGISYLPVKPVSPVPPKKIYPMAGLAGPIIITVWIVVALFLFLKGSDIMSNGNAWIGFLVSTLGICLLGIPFISNKNK